MRARPRPCASVPLRAPLAGPPAARFPSTALPLPRPTRLTHAPRPLPFAAARRGDDPSVTGNCYFVWLWCADGRLLPLRWGGKRKGPSLYIGDVGGKGKEVFFCIVTLAVAVASGYMLVHPKSPSTIYFAPPLFNAPTGKPDFGRLGMGGGLDAGLRAKYQYQKSAPPASRNLDLSIDADLEEVLRDMPGKRGAPRLNVVVRKLCFLDPQKHPVGMLRRVGKVGGQLGVALAEDFRRRRAAPGGGAQ